MLELLNPSGDSEAPFPERTRGGSCVPGRCSRHSVQVLGRLAGRGRRLSSDAGGAGGIPGTFHTPAGGPEPMTRGLRRRSERCLGSFWLNAGCPSASCLPRTRLLPLSLSRKKTLFSQGGDHGASPHLCMFSGSHTSLRSSFACFS